MAKQRMIMGLLFFLASLALIIGCSGGGGGGGAENNPAVPVNGLNNFVSFGGTVTYNGKPMNQAAVYLIKPQNALNSGIAQATSAIKAKILTDIFPAQNYCDYQTLSDSNGKFLFQQVIPGEYTLIAVKDGRQAVIPNLSINGAITTVDVALTPTGNLIGTVSIPGISDLSAVLVYLEGTSYVAITDITGKFALYNIPAGTYRLKAQKGSFALSSSISVTIVAAQDNTAPAIVLTAQETTADSGNIIGKVVKSGASSSAGVIVHIQGTRFIAMSDPSGDYKFTSVPVGTYTLNYFASGYLDASPQSVVIRPNQTVTVPTVTLLPSLGSGQSAGIRGRVIKIATKEDSESNQVALRIATGTFEKITISASDGSFAFEQIAPGLYNLEILNSNYILASGNPVVVEAKNPANDYGTFFANLNLTGTGRIIGSVAQLPNGSYPSGNVFLFQENVNGPVRIAQLGYQGSFQFSNLNAGNYRIDLDPQTNLKIEQPAGFFQVLNGQTVTRSNLPVVPLLLNIISYSQSGTTITINTTSDFDHSYKIIFSRAGIEHVIPTSVSNNATVFSGDFHSLSPGVYKIYLKSEVYNTVSNVASTPFVIGLPSVVPSSIKVTTSLSRIDVAWQGVPNAASYSVIFYKDNNTTTEVASVTEIYKTEASWSPTAVVSANSWRVGVVAHANGVSSQISLNPAWVRASRNLNNPRVYNSNIDASTFGDTMVGNGSLYFIRQSTTSSLYRVELGTFVESSKSGFAISSVNPFGCAGTTGIYLIATGSNLTIYKSSFDLSSVNSQNIAANAQHPRIVQAPDGYIHVFWLDSDNYVNYASGSDYNALGSPIVLSIGGIDYLITAAVGKASTGEILPMLVYNQSGTIKKWLWGYPLSQDWGNGRRVANYSNKFYGMSESGGETTIVGIYPWTVYTLATYNYSYGIDMVIDGLGRIWTLSQKDTTNAPYTLQIQVFSNTGMLLQGVSYSDVTNTDLRASQFYGRKFLNYDPVNKEMILAFPGTDSKLKVYCFDASHSFE